MKRRPHNKRRPRCVKCNAMGEYSTEWDAYYCPFCARWLEETCEEPGCVYCTKRPAFGPT